MKITSTRYGLIALAFFAICVGAPALAQPAAPDGQASAPAMTGGKSTWTPAESKLDANLLFATRAFATTRGTIPQGRESSVQAFIDQNVAPDQTIFVVIRADVSPDLVALVKATGAYDISEFPVYKTITARVPITALVDIAQRSDVFSIGPRELMRTNRWVPTSEEMAAIEGATPNAGSALWQGVGAHKADLVQNTGINGSGVMVCVLSDGVNSLAARQASGDLPAVTVLAGQAGSGDEGTAMLEIIHDIAPGATLGFATANPSQAQFAANITGLKAAGCNIIVDDITYYAEGAFQDGTVSAAVNTVTAGGALYFSSAANSGNKTQATSGTYEGDFVASGMPIPAVITTFETPLPAGGISLHAFPSGNNYTTLTGNTSIISLKWSDPLLGSTNDYDLIVTNSTGTAILCTAGGNAQSGGVDPVEFAFCNPGSFGIGARVYIVKYGSAAATRALRLDTNRGIITQTDATTGNTYGHNAAGTGLTVASIGYNGGSFLSSTPFTGGVGTHLDYYSSDGPRKLFYNPNGTAITPGNVLFGTGGGTTLAKVDLTASDCGTTTTPNFIPFCGTSAAAPTAAAIAALIKSAKPVATSAQITTALKNSALDIEAAGIDRDSGVGIVMADAAVRNILSPLTIAKNFAPSSIATGGTSVLTIQVTNPNTKGLASVAFTDTYPSPQVKNAPSPNPGFAPAGCTATFAAVAGGGTFVVTNATIPASTTCTFTVTVTSSTVGSYPDATGAVTTPIALNTAAATATLIVTGVAGGTPVLLNAVARKVHGGAGTFDLPLTLTTPPTINLNPTTEPRAGPTHQLIFTFDKPLTSATTAVSEGTATIGAGSGTVGSTVVINLTGVTNAQYVTVSLSNVASSDGGTGGAGTARVGFLEGDINQNRVVTVSDVALVNGALAQLVSAANYLRDVNASGTLTLADKALANAKLTTALPPP